MLKRERSFLGEHRPSYKFTCGVCGKVIDGRSNTVHLAISSHIRAEYRKGLRSEPFTNRRDLGQKWR